MSSTPPPAPPADGPDDRLDVRLSPRLAVRLMGTLLVVAAVLLILTVIAIGLLSLPSGVLTGAVVVVGAGVMVGVVLLARRGYVVRLTAEGYRVRFVRGAGVTRGRWSDVADAVTAEVAGARCLVLRRRDGSTTTIPVDLLDSGPDDFVREVRRRLTRGRGLRPLS